MTHLTPDELSQWLREDRAEDRDPVLSHVSSCSACRTALSNLVKMQVPAVESTGFDGRDFVTRGHDVYSDTVRIASRWKWGSTVSALGVAAALALAALVIPPRDVRVPFEFRWSSPVAASSYRVSVFDASNHVIDTESSRTERLPVAADLRARLVTGEEYTWSVEALDAADSRILGSSRQPFTIARER
jgi:hypothetical protein